LPRATTRPSAFKVADGALRAAIRIWHGGRVPTFLAVVEAPTPSAESHAGSRAWRSHKPIRFVAVRTSTTTTRAACAGWLHTARPCWWKRGTSR
jgi:hypothetical protein